MSTHPSPAIRLATDIAVQFHYLPTEAGAAAVAHHIRTYWDPRLRRQLDDGIESGTDVDPLVIEAAKLLA